ncbi:hypothetical protein BH11PSE3_BH11PSE3_07830 [soil metagenome]
MSEREIDIIEELRSQCLTGEADRDRLERDVRWRAAAEIEQLRRVAAIDWQPMQAAPKDNVPVLLFCPRLKGHVADEIVVGVWRFDANRRTFGFWVSDVGVLDNGFSETGPWIEYHELHPKMWAPLPARPDVEA